MYITLREVTTCGKTNRTPTIFVDITFPVET